MTKSHPQLDGELVLPEFSAPVRVHRDALSVPHIRAETEADAMVAMGSVHAQARRRVPLVHRDHLVLDEASGP